MANQVLIQTITKDSKTYLQFDFKGHLDDSSAQKAIIQWRETIKQSGGLKIDVIYNCNDMTGFDTEARKNWQTTMSELKNNIGDIWIVSTNIFILGASKTMGILTGFKIKVSRSLQEVGK